MYLEAGDFAVTAFNFDHTSFLNAFGVNVKIEQEAEVLHMTASLIRMRSSLLLNKLCP